MQNPALCSIYAQAVFDGKRTLESVPSLLREGVEELLVEKYVVAIKNQSKQVEDVPEELKAKVLNELSSQG